MISLAGLSARFARPSQVVGKQLSKAPLEQGRATAAGMSAADLWPFAWWLVPYKK
jgi:hypothetical protein